MMMIMAIASGGALGSVLRHFLNLAVAAVTGGGFPWGIFLINVFGSLLMGLLAGLFAHAGEPPQAFKAFLTVGVLGGFTTFSAFSLDAATLIGRGATAQAAFYTIGSPLLAIAGLYAGMALGRMLAS